MKLGPGLEPTLCWRITSDLTPFRTLLTNLYIPVFMAVHILKEFLVVGVLLVPFCGFVEAEVISKWNEEDVGFIEGALLAVLIQENFSPEEGKRGNKIIVWVSGLYASLLKGQGHQGIFSYEEIVNFYCKAF